MKSEFVPTLAPCPPSGDWKYAEEWIGQCKSYREVGNFQLGSADKIFNLNGPPFKYSLAAYVTDFKKGRIDSVDNILCPTCMAIGNWKFMRLK